MPEFIPPLSCHRLATMPCACGCVRLKSCIRFVTYWLATCWPCACVSAWVWGAVLRPSDPDEPGEFAVSVAPCVGAAFAVGPLPRPELAKDGVAPAVPLVLPRSLNVGDVLPEDGAPALMESHVCGIAAMPPPPPPPPPIPALSDESWLFIMFITCANSCKISSIICCSDKSDVWFDCGMLKLTGLAVADTERF